MHMREKSETSQNKKVPTPSGEERYCGLFRLVFPVWKFTARTEAMRGEHYSHSVCKNGGETRS